MKMITQEQILAKPSQLSIYLLFILLIIAWGFGWPVIKTSISYCPPCWFVSFRFIVALVAVTIYLLITKQLRLPKLLDIPLLCSVGLLQIALYILLVNIGLKYVAPGQSAILSYSTPLIVTPIACIWFGEQLYPLKLIGLFLGLAGILILFSPWTINWHDHNMLLGNCLLLLAAISNTMAMLHMRFAKWHSSALQLLPWQLLIAAVLTLIFSWIIDHPTIIVNMSFIGCLAYLALIATAFGYWASMQITKSLPLSTTSMCLLAVPVTSLLSSMFFLGEHLTTSVLIAFVLILGGLICVVFPKRIGT